jgi:deoxyribonuclease-4
MLFGAHLSTEGGLPTAFDRADEEGCDTLQIFTKNKGAWAARPLTKDEINAFRARASAFRARADAFRARASASRARPVVAHSAYLINIASPSKDLRKKSIEALRVELERCEALGIDYLVLHPGSHGGTGEDEGLRRVAASLDRVHRATKGFTAKILLETAAGQGSSVCARFPSLGAILRRVKDPGRLGVCVDTCHVFAAGYDLRTREGYEAAMDELDREVGVENVLCIHANDSKKELGTRVDRHEHIGRGCLGLAGLRRIVNDPRLAKVPFIFELPPENGMTRVNLAALRGLVRGAKGRAGGRARATVRSTVRS